MLVLSAEKVLQADLTDIREHLKGDMILKFHDGDIETNGFETIVSRYAWRVLEEFPKLKLSKRYHVKSHMKNNSFKASTLSDVFAAMWVDSWDVYKISHKHQSKMWALFMRIHNDFINDVMTHYAKYRMTVNVEDMLDIMFDDEILNIKEENPVNKETILKPNYVESIYRQKTKRLESPDFKENNLVKMLKCGVIKHGQLMQCIGPRGSVTDINSDIFAEPISAGYIDGFMRIYDVLIESRTAAMSLNNQSGPLKFTEYLSRRIQFVAMQLKNLHFGDCKSPYHLTWQVRASRDGSVMSDLELLEGMNYLDEETNKYRQIKKSDTHLIGKRLKVRTILGCQHKDPYGVCSTCLGASANNVPAYRNVGHFAIVTLTSIISQLVLSTKHMTSSAVASVVQIDEQAKRYLESTNSDLAAKLINKIKDVYESIRIRIASECLIGLSDIVEVDDVSILSAKRTSSLNRFQLELTTKKGEIITENIDIASFHDEGFLSLEMLSYMKKKGWTIEDFDDASFITVDMCDWDFNLPIVEITSKQFDTFQYSKGIEKLLLSSVSEVKRRASQLSPEAFVMELIDVVNQKLHINMGIMQIVAYTMLCVDVEGRDYSLPKPWTKHSVGNLDSIVLSRSLSAAYSYEKQATTILNPLSFLLNNRMDSPMDEFFAPDKMPLEYLDIKTR